MTNETKALGKNQDKPMTPVDRQMLTLMESLSRRQASLANLLPPGSDVKRFEEGVRFALAQNPDLLKCSPGSIMIACMKAAKLGVDVSGGALGHGYLVPYGDECTFVQGYKGLVSLAVAAGGVKDVTPVLVYENDEFSVEEGDNPVMVHKPLIPRRLDQARGDIIAAYTRVTLPDGTRVIKGYMDLHDIHRIESGVRGSKSPWRGPHRPEMVKKSTVRNAFKTLGVPESERGQQFRRAVEADIEAEAYDVEGEVVEQKSAIAAVKESLRSRALPEPTPVVDVTATRQPVPATSTWAQDFDRNRTQVSSAPEVVMEEPTNEQVDEERKARAAKKEKHVSPV